MRYLRATIPEAHAQGFTCKYSIHPFTRFVNVWVDFIGGKWDNLGTFIKKEAEAFKIDIDDLMK